jgi:DNA-binding transcriptional MerR regulator
MSVASADLRNPETRTVGDVASLAGVTVRTLHHYDEVGLLRPSERSRAGYRLYTGADLERLQEILFFRELGFSLSDIAAVLEEPTYNRSAALRQHREMLAHKVAHMSRMIDAIDAAISAHDRGTSMTTEDMFAVFGDFDPAEHEAEAEERWGETDAWKESRRRTSGYSKDDWHVIKDEGDEISHAFAAALASGVPPESEPALEIAERHRRYIERWFYRCTRNMHANLAQMYVSDARFAATWDEFGDGVAEYVSEAILANARR